MKEILNDLTMPSLTLKQTAVVWYFTVSLFSVASIASAPTWIVIALLLNFINAARLIRKVPIPSERKERTDV